MILLTQQFQITDILRSEIFHFFLFFPRAAARIPPGDFIPRSRHALRRFQASLLVVAGDALDLDGKPHRQRRNLYAGARRIIRAEVFRIELIDLGKIAQIRQKDGRLKHVIHRKADLTENRLDIFKSSGFSIKIGSEIFL